MPEHNAFLILDLFKFYLVFLLVNIFNYYNNSEFINSNIQEEISVNT